jgi:hypothetical protein
MFFAALFTVAKLWKQPRCPTTDKWIKKMWYLYTKEFYAAMNKNEMLSFAGKWMELENIILNEVSLAQKTKNHMFSLISGHKSRVNTTRGLDSDHIIKVRAHKGYIRIGKTSKKLVSIRCPQCRESKVDNLKATETNRRRGPGTTEKVRSRRINLEGNTHAQEINVFQLPV